MTVDVCSTCCSPRVNQPRIFLSFSQLEIFLLDIFSFCLFLSKCLTVLGSLAIAIFFFVCFVFLSYKFFPWCLADLLNSLPLSSFILRRESSQTLTRSPFLLLTKCWINRSILSTAMHCNSVTITMSYILSIIFPQDFLRCHK